MDFAFLLPLLQSLVAKYPFLLTALLVIGICRLLMKPVFQILAKYLELEPNPEKRAKIERLLNSRVWKTLAFATDLIFSVKLPYVAGSVGARVQEAVQKEKGETPALPPAAGV